MQTLLSVHTVGWCARGVGMPPPIVHIDWHAGRAACGWASTRSCCTRRHRTRLLACRPILGTGLGGLIQWLLITGTVPLSSFRCCSTLHDHRSSWRHMLHRCACTVRGVGQVGRASWWSCPQNAHILVDYLPTSCCYRQRPRCRKSRACRAGNASSGTERCP